MAKLMGNLRIRTVPQSEGVRPHFEVVFVPYAGRPSTGILRADSYEELVNLLMDLKFGEDESTRWAGKARAQGIILIDSFERTDSLLREKGLLV